jgi:hypothetical protein
VPDAELQAWRSRNFTICYPCPHCDATFLSSRTLTEHIVINHLGFAGGQQSGTGPVASYQQIDGHDAGPVSDSCPPKATWDETVESWLGFTIDDGEREESGWSQ